jgi:hypothetical protein
MSCHIVDADPAAVIEVRVELWLWLILRLSSYAHNAAIAVSPTIPGA